MQAPYTITLDGTRLTGAQIDGTLDMSFEYEDNVITTGQQFTFHGSAIAMLRDKLLCGDAPENASCAFVVTDNCCTNPDGTPLVLIDGIITSNNVNYCVTGDACTLTASVTSNDVVAQKLACLKNHFIWERQNVAGTINTAGENAFRVAPRTVYCKDPSLFAVIMGVITKIIIQPSILIIALIVTVINALINAVNLIPGVNIDNIDFDGNDDTNAFQEVRQWVRELEEAITGCGRKHKTPFVHSYLTNIAELCGMTLKSTLFDPGGVYHDTMRLDASRVRGDNDEPGISDAYEANKPTINGKMFLDDLKRDFNICYRVTDDGVLCVDHEDVLNADAPTWLDMATLDPSRINSFCVEAENVERCAFGIYNYADDNIDTAGDSVTGWGDVVNWNEPPAAGQAGACVRDFAYGQARFRQDVNFAGKDTLRAPFGTFLGSDDFDGVLVIEKDKAALPKLLIWDGVSDLACAKILRQAAGNGLFEYNIPWRVSRSPIQGTNTLYQNLLYSDNPRTQGGTSRKFTLTIRHTCEHVSTLRGGAVIGITHCGRAWRGRVDRVTWDRVNMTITGRF